MTPQQDSLVAPLPTFDVATQRWYQKPAVYVPFIISALVFACFVAIGAKLLSVRQQYKKYLVSSESMLPTARPGDRVMLDTKAYENGVLPKHEAVVVFAAPPGVGRRNGKEVTFIKRVVGLPGDSIQITGASLTIDGTVISAMKGKEPHQYLRDELGLASGQSIRICSNHIQIDDGWELIPAELAQRLGRIGAEIHLHPGVLWINGRAEEPELQTQEDASYNFPARGGAFKVPAGCLFVLGDNRNHSADSRLWGPIEVRRLRGRVMPKIGKKSY